MNLNSHKAVVDPSTNRHWRFTSNVKIRKLQGRWLIDHLVLYNIYSIKKLKIHKASKVKIVNITEWQLINHLVSWPQWNCCFLNAVRNKRWELEIKTFISMPISNVVITFFWIVNFIMDSNHLKKGLIILLEQRIVHVGVSHIKGSKCRPLNFEICDGVRFGTTPT